MTGLEKIEDKDNCLTNVPQNNCFHSCFRDLLKRPNGPKIFNLIAVSTPHK